MDPNIENTSGGQIQPSSSKVLRVILIAILIAFSVGGGYWYYKNYIMGGKVSPTPTPEFTEAIWKTKAEKTVDDFLELWSQSSNTADGLGQAKKAKDLLTIVLQAKLETLKDDNGQLIQGLPSQLDKLLDVTTRDGSFKIISSQKIDERNVDVRVNLSYNRSKDKVLRVVSENNIWLIDDINDYLSSPSPTPSNAASSAASASPGVTPFPTISPKASL